MSVKHWLTFVALLCLQTPALAAHSGSAPIEPQEPDDEHFVVDTDTGLDTGCTYRDGGPLRFKVRIDRYVGEVNADGTLKNHDKLIQNKVISPTAQLLMPAYDIDFEQGEIDKVYFNGHELSKPLTGTDGTWNMNRFEVPIEWVKFSAVQGADRNKPTPAENEIRIDIDENNEGWCAAIDWAELQFKAMAPLVLIHGIGANPRDAWEIEPGVTEYLTSLGVPFEHRIPIQPNGTILRRITPEGEVIPGNADFLELAIRTVAQHFGVQKVHLVGHSKGGLDSRGYLANNYNPDEVKVLSLHTITTPHQGSALADISYEARTNFLRPVAQAGDDDMETFLRSDFLLEISGRGPQLPGLRDLQTEAMRDFNRGNAIPNGVKFYTYGADADLDNDGDITVAEANPLIPNRFPINAARQGTVLYHILRDVSTITLDEDRIPSIGIVFRREIERVPTTSPQINDLAVTETSSQHPSQLQHFGPLDRNHRNVKDPETMDSILNTIRNDFPVN